jgi:hypothetical protein
MKPWLVRAAALPFSAALMAAFIMSAARAQSPCAPRHEMAAALGGYGERVVARGLAQDGTMIEVYTTPDGATWSLVITQPGNLSCLTGAGKAWQDVAPSPRKTMGHRI